MSYQSFVQAMHRGMEKMMHDMHAAPPSGQADVDFLAMMIPHHAGAIEMARLLLQEGRDPLVRQLAGEIIASQSTEIQAMRERLRRLSSGQDANPDGFPALGSFRGN
jgi:uncharacterized protein (DUF305 family)